MDWHLFVSLINSRRWVFLMSSAWAWNAQINYHTELHHHNTSKNMNIKHNITLKSFHASDSQIRADDAIYTNCHKQNPKR